MFCVALASLVLATSCSQDDLQTAKFSQNPIKSNVGLGGQPISTFAAAKGKAVKSRAVETTITNLGSFTMNAFQDGETNYMKDVKYTSTDGSVWNTDAGTFYWPVEGNLHFYAYAPEQPGQAGTFKPNTMPRHSPTSFQTQPLPTRRISCMQNQQATTKPMERQV